MIVQVSIAAAIAILGYDLLTGEPGRSSSRPRTLVAAGLTGSAAALDSKISLKVGSLEVGRMFNSNTGAPNKDAMFRVGVLVPAGEEVHGEVTDAPVTNPLNLALDFAD